MGLDRAKFSLKLSDYDDIDSRLKPYMPKDLGNKKFSWYVEQIYKDEKVQMPYDQDSGVYPIKYFEVRKDPHEANYDPNHAEDEIGLTLWAGWKGQNDLEFYDHEVEINLFILASDVAKSSGYKVSAEIIKTGGAYMRVFFYGNELTDFTEKKVERIWWQVNTIKTPKDKIWIEDLESLIPKEDT